MNFGLTNKQLLRVVVLVLAVFAFAFFLTCGQFTLEQDGTTEPSNPRVERPGVRPD
jgi:hypothetical protein